MIYLFVQKAKEFRLKHDARVELGKKRRLDNNIPASEFSYGKPNRPSTPINGVISNHYGDSALLEL